MSKTINSPKTNQNKSFSVLAWILVFLVIVTLGTGCAVYDKITEWFSSKKVKETVEEFIIPPAVSAQKFADYEEVSVNITPQVASYSIEKDLSNVINTDQFYLSDKAQDLLAQNGFVVTPAYWEEFFSLYERNRYSYIPNFITTDSMLHNYHLAFDYLLRDLEKNELTQEVTNLTYEMLKASKSQYEDLKGTEWENAAKRNVAFFTVANKTIYPEAVIPDYVKEEVNNELSLMEAHEGIKPSPVMNIGRNMDEEVLINTPQGRLPLEAFKEDYSQYIPRGHYTKSDELKAYFKSMMYLGRITFRLKSDDETKSAVLITLALKGSDDLRKSWDKVYEPTVFFVGKADDLSFYDYADTLESVYGTDLTVTKVTSDKEKFEPFWKKAMELEPPQINSMPIFAPGIQEDREEEIKGFRFMGQRFTIDASVFQRLIYREVGDKVHSCEDDPTEWQLCPSSRCLPKGLDIPAAMGSDQALSILEEMGEKDYACYTENMSKMKKYIAELDKNTWTQNLYWGWLDSLRPLLDIRGEGWPIFMQNTAWVHKNLNTYLGSWTELKHDTILYAKQAYAELGGGPPEEYDDRGYVEPNPDVFARLAALIKMMKEGLQIRNLLSSENGDFLGRMETLALRLKEIAEKELNGVALSDDDYDLIRTYGGSLEHFWIEAFKDRGITSASQLSDEPAPIVADVATDPNGVVLEEGTGNITDIYVVFSLEGKLRIAKGGVYTHYEFTWPMSDRLTDEKWRELLISDDKPAMADWTKSFIVQE